MKVASIATYEERLDVLIDAVNSLSPQVDVVQVYFNDTGISEDKWQKYHETIYLNCEGDNIKVDLVPDMKDLSKFLAIWEYPEATIFTCDDDIIYGKDYVYSLYKNLHYEYLVQSDVITTGGKVISDLERLKKYHTYSKIFNTKYRFDGTCRDNYCTRIIDVPLSGVSAFDAKHFQDCKLDKKYIFAADILLAKWIKEKGLICNRSYLHKKIVSYNKAMKGKDTIFDSHTKKKGRELGKMVKDIFAEVK